MVQLIRGLTTTNYQKGLGFKLRLEWLKKYGEFSHGIPVLDTIARLVCRIDPQTFHQRFIQWMQATEKLTDKQVVAVDGKTLRRSYKRNDRQSRSHMISAFATKNGVVLGPLELPASIRST
ncbi:ISAs1 family transposase [Idiomarina baltica]|uniref:H repeat-associated protein N-terminal domain-containing protein n=1 Tax=Idiomarina baltica OS145 TaxID=314276 RepID=A0ABP2CTK8_9GAMM|nr:ISAs1 family transposase [Idiomarina baltica]EAQ33210.1 hypothetical protein OS145_02540 [Idiomarina baltica OS145]